MSDDRNDKDEKSPLGLSRPGKLELRKTVEAGQVRQSFSHGRSKVVTVEVRKKRTFEKNEAGRFREVKSDGRGGDSAGNGAGGSGGGRGRQNDRPRRSGGGGNRNAAGKLTSDERLQRAEALRAALRAEEERRRQEAELAARRVEEEARRKREEEARRKLEEEEARRRVEEEARAAAAAPESAPTPAPEAPAEAVSTVETPAAPGREAPARPAARAATPARPKAADKKAPEKKKAEPPRRGRDGDSRRRGKLTISAALSGEEGRQRSLAAMRRAQAKAKQQRQGAAKPKEKVFREVVIPDSITVQELANRMAERAADVIKTLMGLGVMATINQSLDPDTAQLVVDEFGHKVKRVSDADVEEVLQSSDDRDEDLSARPPVVTVMGHVDHGKTSLLDALRKTDVVSGEAGGITQHIGAYQVRLQGGEAITFIDTPGHAAFTEMRARGAKVTDIVVLVVAADDSVMPQTVEAISHAKAAGVPMVVAVNKIDKPGADPNKVKTELLQYEVVVEDMGGEVQCVPVSAKTGEGLQALEEAILLQAEILDLKANPERTAEGVVVEAKMEQGRGSVATVLIGRGTLNVGDIFVTGPHWGRVRAMIDDRGRRVEQAAPGMPVEVLGLQGTPSAGDDFVVVEAEAKAREVADFRQRRIREQQAAAAKRSNLEQMFSKIKEGEVKELPVVIKADVQGSVEALIGTLGKLGNEEVQVKVLHVGVGGINESDITLARASDALIIGFNVRANQQAREQARRDGIDIRYYSIIYDVADDVKKALTGMLSPELRERFLGYAEIREVFNVTKVGRVAGCMVTEGVVKRGAKVRLLRDNVVIHSGDLATLRRFKDEVREVKEGYECGMSFANYQDIQVGDMIECFEVEEVAVEL